jgi:dipeptidyl aminopeptidase/acylaminoacyl peptidase
VWDAKAGATLAILLGHSDWVNGASFSPDGSRVATASFDGTSRVWDAKTGTPLATLSGHGDRVIGASFSTDGSRVVTASADKTARVWDAATGAALTVLAGHADWVNGAAFSADGSRVVTASLDRTARVWQLDPIVLTPADQRQAYVCRERLIGAPSFSAKEMQDPFLRDRDELRDPCARAGPLSRDYYRRAALGLLATIRNALWN